MLTLSLFSHIFHHERWQSHDSFTGYTYMAFLFLVLQLGLEVVETDKTYLTKLDFQPFVRCCMFPALCNNTSCVTSHCCRTIHHQIGERVHKNVYDHFLEPYILYLTIYQSWLYLPSCLSHLSTSVLVPLEAHGKWEDWSSNMLEGTVRSSTLLGAGFCRDPKCISRNLMRYQEVSMVGLGYREFSKIPINFNGVVKDANKKSKIPKKNIPYCIIPQPRFVEK